MMRITTNSLNLVFLFFKYIFAEVRVDYLTKACWVTGEVMGLPVETQMHVSDAVKLVTLLETAPPILLLVKHRMHEEITLRGLITVLQRKPQPGEMQKMGVNNVKKGNFLCTCIG